MHYLLNPKNTSIQIAPFLIQRRRRNIFLLNTFFQNEQYIYIHEKSGQLISLLLFRQI